MVKDGGHIYLFCGEEYFLKEAQDSLISKILPSGSKAFNCDIYSAKDESDRAFDALYAPPLFSARKLVVIKDIENLPEPRRDPLLAYLKNPNKNIFLLMQSSQDASGNKFLGSISKAAKTRVFKKPKPFELGELIRKRLGLYEKAISKDALDLLQELKGKEPIGVLFSEIDKLCLYKGKDKTIKREDVVKLVGKSTAKTSFDLVDAVSFRDKDAAIALVGEVAGSGSKTASEIIGLMGWQLRRLWKAKRLLSGKNTRETVCSELRISGFSKDKFFNQAERFTIDELKRGFKLLVDADRCIKTGRNKPEFMLEHLVVDLLRQVKTGLNA